MLLYFMLVMKIYSKIYKNLTILFLFLFAVSSCGGNTFHLNQSMVFFTLFSAIFLSMSNTKLKEWLDVRI